MFKLLPLTLTLSFMMTLSAAEKAKKPTIAFISAKEVFILTEMDYIRLYTYKVQQPYLASSKSLASSGAPGTLKDPITVTIVYNSKITTTKMERSHVKSFIKYFKNKHQSKSKN